jgi:hypothetical protein
MITDILKFQNIFDMITLWTISHLSSNNKDCTITTRYRDDTDITKQVFLNYSW